MTAALAFFFIAVFGDGAYSFSTHGPYLTRESCMRNAISYGNATAFGAALPSSTSACFLKETP